MTDRVRIPFSADMEEEIVWKTEGPKWGWFEHPQYGRVVWTYCPVCKHSSGILVRHTITADGEVNASIQCPFKGCSWHIWGVLDGYTEHGGQPQLTPLSA